TAQDVSIQPPVPLVSRKPRESVSPQQESGPSGRYAFRVLGALPRNDELRSAVVAPDGSSAYALGTLGVYRWNGSSWSVVPSAGGLDPAILDGLALVADSSFLVFGGRGTVVMMSPGGDAQPWRLPDDDVELEGATVERSGVVLVGRRRSVSKGAWIDAVFGRP